VKGNLIIIVFSQKEKYEEQEDKKMQVDIGLKSK